MRKTAIRKPRKMSEKAISSATKLYHELWGWENGSIKDMSMPEWFQDEDSKLGVPTSGQIKLLTFYTEQEKYWFERWMATSYNSVESRFADIKIKEYRIKISDLRKSLVGL